MWAVHNFMMWLAWVFLSGAIIFTSRYGKQYWRNSVFIHAVIGVGIFAITTVGGIMAWVRLGGMAFNKWTSLLENVSVYLAWGLCLCGMVAYYFRRYGKYDWNTKLVLKLLDVHRWFGRVFVIGLQGLIMFAIIDNFGFSANWIFVSGAQFLGFVAVFAVFEFRHQRILSQEVPYVKPASIMTLHEFEERLRGGAKLMILDDLVLDVSEFARYHPGGRFVIEHTVGTDIAKFFYGGYCLEDNLGPKPAFGWRHTNYARMIANDLAIA